MQITEFGRLQVNKKKKTCFDHFTLWEIGEMEEMETNRNLVDGKKPEKSIGRGTENDTWAQKVEMWFLESRWNTKGQTSEIRIVEKPQRNRRNLRNVIWWNQV